MSDLYSVSRGPVREAIRTLEKRGLLELFPRGGAYVVDLSPDLFADLFNIRLTLIGMADRQFDISGSDEAHALVKSRLDAAGKHVATAGPQELAKIISRVPRVIYMNCGNVPLGQALADQVRSMWGMIWHAQPLDFQTRKRRRDAVHDWTAVINAVRSADAPRAEREARAAMAHSRDIALASYVEMRGKPVDPAKL